MHAHIITGTCIILYNIEKYFKTIKDAISQNLDYSSRISFTPAELCKHTKSNTVNVLALHSLM